MPCGDGTGPWWGRGFARPGLRYRAWGRGCRGWGFRGYPVVLSSENELDLLRERLRVAEEEAKLLKERIAGLGS